MDRRRCPQQRHPAAALYDVTINSGTVTLDISPTIQQFLFSGGVIIGSVPSQTLTVAGGIDFHGNSNLSLLTATLNNPASQTATLGASGNASLHFAGTTFNNAGLFLASDTQGIFGTGTFNNSGNFTLNSTGTFTLDSTLNFNNTGTIYVQAGTLAYNAMNGVNITGAFNIASGATLSFAGLEGLTSAASVTKAGNVICTAGVAILTGTYNVTGNTTVPAVRFAFPLAGSTGPVTVSGGTFQSAAGVGNLSISGLLTLSGGTFQAAANANAGIDFHGDGNVILDAATLTNPTNKTATLGASGNVSLTMQNNAIFFNNGSFLATNHAGIHLGTGTNPIFLNAGTFTFNNGNTGTFTIDPAISFRNNNGLLEIKSGTLAMNANFTQTNGKTLLDGGALSSNSTLTFASGTLAGTGAITAPVSLQSASTLASTLGGTTPGTGYDQLNVTGNVSLAGVINISFLNNFNTSILPTDSFTLLTVDPNDTLSGSFLNAADGARINTTDGLGSFLIHYSPAASRAVTIDNFISSATPEPASLFLLTLATLSLLSRRRPATT